MKKLLVFAAIMLVSGAVFAQPDPQAPVKTNPKASKTSKGEANPSSANSQATSSRSSDGVLTSFPLQSESSQLIRSVPYQSPQAVSAQPSTSSKSSRTNEVPSRKAPALVGSHVVVCKVGGYEQRGMSSSECLAKGGVEVVTRELPQTKAK